MDKSDIARLVERVLSKPLAPAPGHTGRCRIVIEVQATGMSMLAAYRGGIKEIATLCLGLFAGDGGEFDENGGHRNTVIWGGATMDVYTEILEEQDSNFPKN